MRIAFVDDEQKYLDEMTELVRHFAAQHCCRIETVPFLNGEAFLETFGEGSFSAVFMDIYMDGIAAAQKIRSIDSRCILVFLTSSSDFMPGARHWKTPERGICHECDRMAYGAAAVSGAAAFRGILLLYSEKPAEAYTAQDCPAVCIRPAPICFSLLMPLRRVAD